MRVVTPLLIGAFAAAPFFALYACSSASPTSGESVGEQSEAIVHKICPYIVNVCPPGVPSQVVTENGCPFTQCLPCTNITLDGLPTAPNDPTDEPNYGSCCTDGGANLCGGEYGRVCAAASDAGTGAGEYCQTGTGCPGPSCAWTTSCSGITVSNQPTTLEGTYCCASPTANACDGYPYQSRACWDPANNVDVCQIEVTSGSGIPQFIDACSNITILDSYNIAATTYPTQVSVDGGTEVMCCTGGAVTACTGNPAGGVECEPLTQASTPGCYNTVN